MVMAAWARYGGAQCSEGSPWPSTFLFTQRPMVQANPQSFTLKLLKLSSIAKRKDLLTVTILLANLGGFMILGGNQFEL